MNITTLFRKTKPRSLFDRMGGGPVLNLAVDLFHHSVKQDTRINHLFMKGDSENIKSRQREFIAQALGGTSDRQKPKSHLYLSFRQANLSDWHFDIIVFHLTRTLRELGITDEHILEVYGIAQTVRTHV